MGIKSLKRTQMGQRYAKHQMQTGVKLYHKSNPRSAIGHWKSALRGLRSNEEKFIIIGYIAQAYCDSGDYELMLRYCLQQMELANSCQDDFMEAESCLNLSKAYEKLADFSAAIHFGRMCLKHSNMDPRTPGYAFLVIALSQLGLSQFQGSLRSFERAMAISNRTKDKLLELQVCIGLSLLFTLLRDLNKALIFLRNAHAILQDIVIENVKNKYRAIIFYHLSVVLRLKGALTDAHEACEEALVLSQQTNNRSIYARSLCNIANINREMGESEAMETITKSWGRYEESFRISREIKDRMGELIVLASMAKSASESRTHYLGQCECQAILLNKKCLELAEIIGCKLTMMKCHIRLKELYLQLSDAKSFEVSTKIENSLADDMEITCDFCQQRLSFSDDFLQALWCSHIFHSKCLEENSSGTSNGQSFDCPKCSRPPCPSGPSTSLRPISEEFDPTNELEDHWSDQPTTSEFISTKTSRLISVGTSTTTSRPISTPPEKMASFEKTFVDVIPIPLSAEPKSNNVRIEGQTPSLSTTINRLLEMDSDHRWVTRRVTEPALVYQAGDQRNHVSKVPNSQRQPNCTTFPVLSNEIFNYRPTEIPLCTGSTHIV